MYSEHLAYANDSKSLSDIFYAMMMCRLDRPTWFIDLPFMYKRVDVQVKLQAPLQRLPYLSDSGVRVNQMYAPLHAYMNGMLTAQLEYNNEIQLLRTAATMPRVCRRR